VYTKNHAAASLPQAFQNLTQNHLYQDFIANGTIIDGVWDDHDYGVNDAGGYVANREARQLAYKAFLSSAGNVPLPWVHSNKDGLYHNVEVSINGLSVNLIFLDTRSFRDPHFVRSLGEVKFPFSALVASAIRGFYSVMGIGRSYNGKMLGETQWTWLEEVLQESQASMHVIISSVQILTTNPVFESWGHFPQEKDKLFKLLSKYDPPGLVFLSGDVHLGEISQATVRRTGGETTHWKEVTSSGLTHTCADGLLNRFLCPLMMEMFSEHRERRDRYYLGRNFVPKLAWPQTWGQCVAPSLGPNQVRVLK
jgi:alkaline phosphatase D